VWRRAGYAGLAAWAVAAAAGCGGGDDLVTLDRIGRADAPKTLKLQINAGHSPQASTQKHADGFRDLFVKWIRQHPEWRIDLNIISDTQSTLEQARLLEKARVGEAPDCASVDSYAIPLFVQQGVLEPLDRFFTESDLRDLFPFVREVITGPDGHIYAWWWHTDLRVIYRRTDLVPRAPRTWDELIEFAREAERKDPKVDGYLFNGGRWEAATFDNLAYFWMQGGELLDPKGRPVFAEGANAERMLNVLELLDRAVESGAAPTRVTTITNYDEFETAALGGSVAMFLGGSFQWPTLEELLSDEELEKWEVSEIPGPRPGQTSTGTGGWTIGAFADDPEKVAACMDIVKEVFVGEGNNLMGELPTSQRLFATLPEFQRPIYRTFARFLRHGQARPGLSIYPSLSNELQIAIGSVLTGSATPRQALDTARDRVQQTYELMSGGSD
jgi:multiple sugar transport system substrate-binding protein